ncbi:MAG: ABC transporter substrate-binding protein [Deltaproteobacteria bacterium]|nr:ABC transporter substrate-binding protein [Deltaproteobacteria bacterium]
MARLSHLEVLYGKMEGTDGRFTRDPTGFLGIDAGIFHRRGLDVTYRYLQSTEERYREIEKGSANISLVVGRMALRHFLATGKSRLIGCSMNSCPYRLVAEPGIQATRDLRGKSVACRENIARSSPLPQALHEKGGLKLNQDVDLKLPPTDKDALDMLHSGKVQAALLTQIHGLAAEEKGFLRISDWPPVVDDPLPLVLETTEDQFKEKRQDLAAFVEAYRETIVYLKNNRSKTIEMLRATFGQSELVAENFYEDCASCLSDPPKVDMQQLAKLVAAEAPNRPGGAKQVASEWIVPGALKS